MLPYLALALLYPVYAGEYRTCGSVCAKEGSKKSHVDCADMCLAGKTDTADWNTNCIANCMNICYDDLIFGYVASDANNGFASETKKSAAHCQAWCQEKEECYAWQWDDDGHCVLKAVEHIENAENQELWSEMSTDDINPGYCNVKTAEMCFHGGFDCVSCHGTVRCVYHSFANISGTKTCGGDRLTGCEQAHPGTSTDEGHDTPPTEPTDTPSTGPTDTPPTEPTDTPSTGPTDTPPTEPTDTPSTGPTDTPPTEPTDTPPTKPTDTPPTKPTDTPTKPTDTPPTKPTGTPTKPTTQPPATTKKDSKKNIIIPVAAAAGGAAALALAGLGYGMFANSTPHFDAEFETGVANDVVVENREQVHQLDEAGFAD